MPTNLDLDGGGIGPEGEESQIRVPAADWDKLSGWLDAKGVDVEEMFGGEIEVEGAEGETDEINFDDLEDIDVEGGEHEAKETPEEEEKEKAEGDDDDDVDESVTGMKKQEDEKWPNLTK